jgi:hypothetical protein
VSRCHTGSCELAGLDPRNDLSCRPPRDPQCEGASAPLRTPDQADTCCVPQDAAHPPMMSSHAAAQEQDLLRGLLQPARHGDDGKRCWRRQSAPAGTECFPGAATIRHRRFVPERGRVLPTVLVRPRPACQSCHVGTRHRPAVRAGPVRVQPILCQLPSVDPRMSHPDGIRLM